MNKKSILDMAMGAIKERVDSDMGKIIDNILDPTTYPTAKRKLQLEMVFQPDSDRAAIVVSVTTKSKLAPSTAVRTSLYVSNFPPNGDISIVEMPAQVPGQIALDEPDQEEPAVLKIVDINR